QRNILFLFLITLGNLVNAQLNIDASRNLLQRLLPRHADQFEIKPLNQSEGKDIFQIESKGNKIVLSGNNGVSIASGLYYYLNEYCHCQITWNGVNLNLPDLLPPVPGRIEKTSPYEYRYYLNYCTFNYSMSWWNWDRWEKEIDWMSLHGINMPLAITGEEYTWYEVYKELGFSDDELSGFFSGPAYFSWFWMGNIDGWGGPLPFSWIRSHRDLQQKILQRERELGMKPVLPAFTGHVPAAFKMRFPKAKLKQTNWNNGFADTYILDAGDPMFAKIGKMFLDKQTEIFGTDHLYSADTFNENEPPSDEPTSLAELSTSVYNGMKQADPKATWVMQGWLFYSDRKFWRSPQIRALLDTIPNDHMIILDLAAEIEPVWKRTDAFYGKPWIWNMLNNFGGNTNMFGHLEDIAQEPAKALNNAGSGKMWGIGLTMEGIEQNPVLYELMMSNTWTNRPIDINEWLQSYVRNRYGSLDKSALEAWQILKSTVYNGKIIRDGAESIITGRPTLDSVARWTKTKLNYPMEELLPAWDHLMEAVETCRNSDGFQYDLVDVTRQVLANYALPLQRKWVRAYQQKNMADFKKYSNQFIELIDDMDRLLATRTDFLLGQWISSARSWGANTPEKALYERNARDLITLWGDANSPLHEYSCRQWSGLLTDFYKVRWQKFFQETEKALLTGNEMNTTDFEKTISIWEWQWVNTQKDFPTKPSGSCIEIAKQLYEKYRKTI
ncbi:MAG TPA: alpha-N-acetylglucosaminidase, partial [Bacteroidales bacterium]